MQLVVLKFAYNDKKLLKAANLTNVYVLFQFLYFLNSKQAMIHLSITNHAFL